MRLKNLSQLFDYVWETRPHVSELSGKPLLPKGHFQWHWQMLHLLSKNTYPKYRFESDNIILALPEEHERQNEFEEFNRRRDEMRTRYQEEFEKRPDFGWRTKGIL